MPGYGFSGKPTSTGWSPERMGRAWAAADEATGLQPLVAQGGDWGAFVVDQMGVQAPAGLLAIHTEHAGRPFQPTSTGIPGRRPPPAGLC